jgi:tRNA 2-thiouridine synthesizing protein E
MAFIEFKGQKIEVDDEGYIQDLSKWSPELAEFLAEKDELKLTDVHWKLIELVRDYFKENQVAPPVRLLAKKTAELCNLKDHKEGNKRMYELFPDGPALMLVRYAGLSKPTGCV